MTGDSERGVGETIKTYLTDTPPVEEGGSQSRVIIEELDWFCMEDTLVLSGRSGATVDTIILLLINF